MHTHLKNINILNIVHFIYFIQTMKKFWVLSLLWVILIFWTLAWCWNKQENTDTSDVVIEDISWETDAIINYNDTLVELASKCVMSEDNIRDAYDSESSLEDIQSSISDIINECTNVWESIKNLGDWEWDSSLKDWVIAVIEKEIAYYSKFSEVLPYLQKEELTEDEKWIYDKIFAEVEVLDKELSEASQNLTAIQEEFSKNHWYKLEDEEVNAE